MGGAPRKPALWIPDQARAADLVAAYLRVFGKNPNVKPKHKRPTAVGRALGLSRNTVLVHRGHRLPPFDKATWRPIDVDLLPLRIPVAAKVLATHLRGQHRRRTGYYPSAGDLAADLRWPILRVKRILERLRRAGVLVEVRLRLRGNAAVMRRVIMDDLGRLEPIRENPRPETESPKTDTGKSPKTDTGNRPKLIPEIAQNPYRKSPKTDTGAHPSFSPHPSQYSAMSLPPDPPDDLAEMADRFASRRTRASTWDDILSDEFRAHLRPGPDAASLFVIATAAGIFELSPVQRWRAAHAWVNMGWTTEAVLAAVTALSRPSQGRPRITNAPGLLRSWLDTGPQKARSRLEAHGLPSERGEALKRAREAEQEAADRWATLVARHRAVTKDLSHDERILAARALRRDLIHAIEQRGAPREPLEFLANHCRTLAEHLAFCEMHPELAPPRLNGDPDAR